jgi:hypothetical protein
VTRFSLVVLAAVGLASGSSVASAAPPGWHTFAAHGVSVRYPPGWFATARPLTEVTSPQQILAVSSYSYRPDPGQADGCEPREALDHLPPTGAFIFGWEYGQLLDLRAFPARLARFRLSGYAREECVGRSYTLQFREAGKTFQISVTLGARATSATRRTVVRILDSFTTRPR